MSTLYGDGDSPHTERPITSPDQILETFHRGTKTPDQQGIGIEYERLPVFRETGLAVPYADPEDDRSSGSQGGPCVERFLAVLESGRGWRSQRENGHIISLERGQTRITLEPGGQVELSGRVHRSIDTARCELEAF
ncbi:MAG: hypothetical protein ACE5HU_06590, partial [Acidobacteriota bacterium]